jgi:chromosome segregation protein
VSTTTAPARGRLGHRTLQVVQCVDVGRLQTHPVWVRSGALVAVTGLGPTDSNETSKTTWLAAVTLLTGDHGWDVASGTAGQHASRLLFDPPDGDGASRAEHGYVVGVFGPDATTLGVGEGGHLTVWLRINRSAPFLQFRLTPGVLVARGDTHAERIADADRLWRDMPGQSTLGPKQFLGEALGDIPRSTGYVSDRGGKPTRRASLLTSPLSDLTPEEIGDELVDLAGLRPRLRAERDGRRAAAEAAERLAGAQHRLTEERERVRTQLEQIAARVEALTAVDEAAALRDAYLAAQTLGLLEARRQLADRAEKLRTSATTTRLAEELQEARAAVEELRDEGQLHERAEQAERAAADIKA